MPRHYQDLKSDSTMYQNILENQSYSLSGQELMDFLDGQFPIYLYEDLARFDNINEAFNGKKGFILLYLTKDNYGHWCCVLDHPKSIEFFDSYGKKPDDQLIGLPSHFRKEKGQDYPLLTWLLFNQPKPVEYNDVKLQEYSKDAKRNVSTCGRHVGVRLHYQGMPLKKYVKSMTKRKAVVSPDDIVTYLSAQIQ